ncbi:MAG: cytochrome C oxidase subunit IV family protein [Candidatus Protochlamydia sp.]|nr:cytochrome C oxidase subunit IV family protein [Candidatus Protochlamydia sp.]
MHHALFLSVAGFITSLLLTLASYFIIINPEAFSLDIHTAIGVIFTLALLQSIVQLIFFIHVWKENGSYWNLAVFLSTVSIIFIVVFFSIWIMNHLNYNMH